MEELVESLLEKTKKAKERFDLLTEEIADPKLIANNSEWRKKAKERSMIEDVAAMYEKLKKMFDEYKLCESEYQKEKDVELKAMFYDEIGSLKHSLEQLLVPNPPVNRFLKMSPTVSAINQTYAQLHTKHQQGVQLQFVETADK